MQTDPDMLTETKSIYAASYSDIFWRNLVAGMARAIGGVLFQLLFLVIMYNFFMAYAWPYVATLMDTLKSTTNTLQMLEQKASKPLFEWK